MIDVLKNGQPMEIYCDFSTDGGNWLVSVGKIYAELYAMQDNV